jgi:hypothetical protein
MTFSINAGKYVYDIEVSDYITEINSVKDFKEKILDFEYENINLNDIQEIKNDINTSYDKQHIYKLLAEKQKQFNARIKFIFKDMEDVKKLKYHEKIKQAKELIKTSNIQATKSIWEMKDDIFGMLNNIIDATKSKLKEQKKEVNKRYYEKKKQLLNIQEKQLLTEEEKKERKKIANQKYYEKKKQVLNIQEKRLLTEEEKKERKKIANQKYYEKQRDPKEQEHCSS